MYKLRTHHSDSNASLLSRSLWGGLIYDQCPINKHIPYGIRFSNQGIHIFTRLGKHKGRKYIEVRFEIPEGKTVKLVGSSAQLFSNETNRPIKIQFDKIFLSPFFYYINRSDLIQVKMLRIHESMIGESKRTVSGELDKRYWLASYLELPDADKIQIILPQFMVNKQLITLPEVQFRRKWIIGFFVINC